MILSTWSWSVDAIENKANTTYEELNRRSEMSAVSKQLLFRGKLCHVIVGAKRQVSCTASVACRPSFSMLHFAILGRTHTLNVLIS